MVNPGKKLGTLWESQIVDYLISRGAIHAERRVKTGGVDRGDVLGIAGVCIVAASLPEGER